MLRVTPSLFAIKITSAFFCHSNKGVLINGVIELCKQECGIGQARWVHSPGEPTFWSLLLSW